MPLALERFREGTGEDARIYVVLCFPPPVKKLEKLEYSRFGDEIFLFTKGNVMRYTVNKRDKMMIHDYPMKGKTNMNLKELRKKRSLTQIEMAKELGVSGKTVSLIEVGKLKLSQKLSDRIREVYGESVEPAAAAVPETGKKPAKRGRKAKTEQQADKPAAAVETAAGSEEKVGRKARRGRPPKSAAEKKTAVAVSKKSGKAAAKKSAPPLVIQSPFGGEITPDEIYARIGEVDAVYVRVDQNKAYWVRGEENGSIDLW